MKKLLLILAVLFISLTLKPQNITKINFYGPAGIQVNTYNGNMFLQRGDVSISSIGANLSLIFSYNSGKTKLDHGYGYGWTFNYNILYFFIKIQNECRKNYYKYCY